MVEELVRLSEKLFLMHIFVYTTVDVESQDEKPKEQIFTFGPPFYKQIVYFMGYLMRLWWIIFNYEDKHLSKLLLHSLYGSVHIL